ncbi:MAG: alpha/beta hydrolase [Bdellovibrionaceae bacterium]|nr:alpha/beta hydrolase [Pseudobdellovibrionaceae bacterium]MDW8190772.1 alpha/beta hydrolase [Pseudobdellovibrionaceae bacterium]
MSWISIEPFWMETRDGARIYGERRGEGPALVLIYGIACQMNHWIHQINGLSAFYQVVTFDLRGHVRSTPGNPQELTISGLVQDVVEILDFLNLPQAHFAGHSMGVPILLQLSAQHPQRVQSQVLINGFGRNPLEKFLGINLPQYVLPIIKKIHKEDAEAMSYLWRKLVENPLSILIAGATGGFNLDVTELKDIEIYTRGVAHMDLGVFLPLFESLLSFSARDFYPLIKSPTLIIGGEKDRITPAEFQLEMHKAIQNSEFVQIHYGSHCCQLDFPEYVNLLIRNHIERHHLRLLAMS